MNSLTLFLIALATINILALCWVIYKLHSIGNDSETNFFLLKGQLKRIEKSFSVEFAKLTSFSSNMSVKLNNAINQLDNLKNTLSRIESRIISSHFEDQGSFEDISEKMSSLNTMLSRNFQSVTTNFSKVTDSNKVLLQVIQKSLDKSNQLSSGLDSISTTLTTHHNFLVEKIDKIKRSGDTGLQQLNLSLTSLQEEIVKHENLLKPLESFIFDLNVLYDSLEKTIENIYEEEKSLSSMANKHEELIEYVKKLNRTSVDVFEILKLVVLNYSLFPFEKNLTQDS